MNDLSVSHVHTPEEKRAMSVVEKRGQYIRIFVSWMSAAQICRVQSTAAILEREIQGATYEGMRTQFRPHENEEAAM